MFHLLGRVNSSNVMKVLWCAQELDMAYTRQDVGMEHGVVDTPAYRAKNPNGRIPTIEADGEVLWESNSCMRYLCLKAGGDARGLYPSAPMARARVDRWLDWQLSTLQPAERDLFWTMVRTPAESRDMAKVHAAVRNSAVCWGIIENQLSDGRPYIEGDGFTIADICLGVFARRWFGEEVRVPDMPQFPTTRAWYDRIGQRPGFQAWVAPKLY
jgi:glutathione S-transferase